MESALVQLPLELIGRIISYVETARSLLHLSLTCQRLYKYIERDGFRIFVQNQFPSIQTPPFWKDATHALTGLSRNWDRRAFIARYLVPNLAFTGARRLNAQAYNGGRPPGTQTMGYQPVIDSYEEWLGGSWSSRKQVVVWGAGSELFLRAKNMGNLAPRAQQEAFAEGQPDSRVDQHGHRSVWAAHNDSRFVEGRDDIRSINLLPSLSSRAVDREFLVVGRASGDLTLLSASISGSQNRIINRFDTAHRPVQSATVNKASTPLLAVCFSDCSLALYSTHPEIRSSQSFDETAITPSTCSAKPWSTRFLRSDRLAVGFGPSHESIHIYSVGPEGLSKDPIRKFGFSSTTTESTYDFAPTTSSFSADGDAGDTFISGGYNGNARLHDLRSPAPFVAVFPDAISASSSIYSLASFGRERFIVGGSRHCILKIYDLRMPGGKVYYAADLDPCSSDPPRSPSFTSPRMKSPKCCQYHHDSRAKRRNCTIFLHRPHTHVRGHRALRHDVLSPVYSLSSPSPCSPTFFAGLEGKVLELDMVSVMDRHPDPIYKHGPTDVREKWDPWSDVLNLSLYEQLDSNVNLRFQRRVGEIGPSKKGLDDRWPRGE